MEIKEDPAVRFVPEGSMSIQSRLLILLLIVLIPILLIHALIYYDRFNTRRETELRANVELANATGKAFEAYVDGILRQELGLGLTATASTPLPSEDFTRILVESVNDSPAVSNFFWVSPQGRILSANKPEAVGVDISDRDYFKAIVSDRDWVVSNLIISKVTGEPVFSISRGIRDGNGALLGMVVAVVIPDKLNHVLPIERLGDAGVSLLDGKGMHVYRYPGVDYTLEQRNWLKLYPEIAEVLNGKDVATTVVSERTGVKRLVGFTPIASIGWIAAASRSEDEALAAIKSALMRHSAMTLGIALLSFLVAVLVSRNIARPIERIHRYALLLAGGDQDAKVEISGPAELRNLAVVLDYAAHEQKRAEETLRESERRASEARDLLNSIIEGTPDLVAAQDKEFRYLAFNTAYGEEFAGIFGREIRTGMNMLDVLDHLPEDRKNAVELWERALNGETFTIDHEFGDPDRARNCYHMSFSPIRSSDGRIIGAAHILRNITDRKRMEDELRKAREDSDRKAGELEAILDSMADGLVIYGADGRIVRMNAYAQWMLGLTREECRLPMAESIRISRMETENGRALPLEELPARRAINGDTVKNQILRVIRNGTERSVWISASAAPIQAGLKEQYGAILTLRDITERKRMEVELRRSRDELEMRVRERTAELIETNKRLEFRNRELEEFAFIASHDLQEPLRKIQTFASRLEDGAAPYLDEEGRHYLERMMKATETARSLIDALLLYSRITGKDTVFTRVDLRDLIEEVVSDLEPGMEESGAVLDIHHLPVLYADKNQMRHLFRNLISNAVKYRGPEKPVIEIYGSPLEDGSQQIFVRDNGIGFEEQYGERIFRPFQRLVGKGRYNGTGIGLTICRKVVDRHGGTITARSAIGKGSTFIITLPAGAVYRG